MNIFFIFLSLAVGEQETEFTHFVLLNDICVQKLPLTLNVYKEPNSLKLFNWIHK